MLDTSDWARHAPDDIPEQKNGYDCGAGCVAWVGGGGEGSWARHAPDVCFDIGEVCMCMFVGGRGEDVCEMGGGGGERDGFP